MWPMGSTDQVIHSITVGIWSGEHGREQGVRDGVRAMSCDDTVIDKRQ